MKIRGLIAALCVAAAVIAATCKVSAQAPAVNPLAIEFTSLDHSTVNIYRLCVYPNATSTTPTRCVDVPVTQVVPMSAPNVYQLPRSTWAANMPFNTDLWPRVAAIGPADVATPEVAPLNVPFSFRLQVRPVSNVRLVP